MAAIYSGIHIKLKNSKTPWEDKIKLAHFAWISQQCFLPNKEQVLLDWVSHSIVGYYTKKLDLEDDIVQKLWSLLDNILHSKKLKSVMKEGKSVNLRFTIAQVINDFIESSCTQQGPQAGISTVLSCCQGILSIPALAFVYTAKCELMVELISKVSTLACQHLALGEPIKPQVFDILQVSLNQYLQIQRQQSNPNRVFGHVLTQLLQPCLLLRHALNNRSWGKEDDSRVRHQLSKDIRNKLETVLQMGLFQFELLFSYKEELLPEKVQLEKKKGLIKTILTPVNSLLVKLGDSSFYGTENHISVISSSVPLLYKLFLDSYCKDGNQLVCFHMLVRLFECLQSYTFQEKEDFAVTSGCSIGLFALEQLLNLALSNDIYNVAVDRIRHQEVQYNFFQKLAEMLIFNPQVSVPAWFRCLKSLILLNHMIVEPDLDDLVSCAWIDADILEPRVIKSQETLITTLFQTYAKLRQSPKLFEEVVMVICRPAADELRQSVLSPGLTDSLTECLLELPPNQILDIWTMILDKCHSFILPDIKDDTDLSLKLVSLSSLIYSLLFSMKIMDNNTPVPVLQRFQKLMEEMMEQLIKPSLNLVKDHCAESDPAIWLQKLCDSTLLLIYTWVEVNAMTSLNCSKYASQLSNSSSLLCSPIEGWDFSLFSQDKACWEKVVMLSRKENSVSMYYMGLISVQKIKKILMEKRFPTQDDLIVLSAAASFVIHSGGQLISSKDHVSWNGSASTVNTDIFALAHWHLIVSSLPIIHPYVSADDANYIAEFLIETLILAESEGQADHETSITFEKVSSSLLHSAFFPEMHDLQCAFITNIIKMCSTVLPKDQKVLSICGLLSEKNLMWHEDFFSTNKKGGLLGVNCKLNTSSDNSSVCWKNMENAAQNTLSLAKSGSYISFSDNDITHLLKVLEFISALKPDSLKPSDQSRCFILLLSLVRAENSPKSLYFVSSCYKLLIHLISGKHSNAVFKLLYASDILEIVINSLLTTNWELARTTGESQEWQDFVHTVKSFFENFLGMIIERKQSVLLNLEKFLTFVVSSIPNAESTAWNPHMSQLLLLALSTLCGVITSCLQEQNANKQRTESLSSMLQQVVVKMGPVVHQCLKVSAPSQMLPSFLVTCVTTLLEAELSLQSVMKTTKKSRNCLGDEKGLQNVDLYSSFCSQIMRELCYAKGDIAFLKSALHYLTICITVKDIFTSQESMVIGIFSSLKKLLTGPWISLQVIQSFEGELTELFTRLVNYCNSTEFYIIMKLVLQGIEACNLWENTSKESFASIVVIRLLLSCQLNGDNGKLFWSTAPQIITALVTLGKEACKHHQLIPTIVVHVLEAMALLLRQGETFLANPHYVTLTFSILLTVPLDHLKTEDYYNVFLGVHECLYSILQCHSKAMLQAVPSFLNCFHRLVTSVMHEGRQKGDKGSAPECEVIVNCVRLVERMYTHIAAKTEEFTVFSAFIVSHYVNELQKVTLHPAVKKHLTEGIFHILDLCIDRDIKFLNASLQMGVREVFKELYNEYTHYHKTKNQGEEKYTA
ncbi:unhealthy ribosome biogenesis protein 2 homolog [Discoglossus pictus]